MLLTLLIQSVSVIHQSHECKQVKKGSAIGDRSAKPKLMVNTTPTTTKPKVSSMIVLRQAGNLMLQRMSTSRLQSKAVNMVSNRPTK